MRGEGATGGSVACWAKWVLCVPVPVPARLPCHPCPPTPLCSLQSALALPQDPASQGEAYRNALILLGMLVGLRIVTYILLRRKTARL